MGWTQNPQSALWTNMQDGEGTRPRIEEGDDDRGPGFGWLRLDEKADTRVEDRV